MNHLWQHSWYYVAQESEIPNPGDFKTLVVAEQPVIVVRDENGQIRVLFNICRHRDVMVCHEEQGQTRHFVCFFHGWVYDTKGNLVGVRGPGCSIRRFQQRRGLTPLPRVGIHQGRIFASLNAEGESLEAYLGRMQSSPDGTA